MKKRELTKKVILPLVILAIATIILFLNLSNVQYGPPTQFKATTRVNQKLPDFNVISLIATYNRVPGKSNVQFRATIRNDGDNKYTKNIQHEFLLYKGDELIDSQIVDSGEDIYEIGVPFTYRTDYLLENSEYNLIFRTDINNKVREKNEKNNERKYSFLIDSGFCGNGFRDGTIELCDEKDLDGQSCNSLNIAEGGGLSCKFCEFYISRCSANEVDLIVDKIDVEAIKIDPSNPTGNYTLIIKAFVRNLGPRTIYSLAAGSVSLVLDDDEDERFGTGTSRPNFQSAGEVYENTFNLFYKEVEPGRHKLFAETDATNILKETSEDNNNLTFYFNVP